MAANTQAMLAAQDAKFQTMWAQVYQRIATSQEQEVDGSMEWEPVSPDRLARLEQEAVEAMATQTAPGRDHRLDALGVLDTPP